MEVTLFDMKYKEQLKSLLIEAFPYSYGDTADEEVIKLTEEERIAIMAVEEDKLVGFVGAIPNYGITGWELHPMIVKKEYQKRGIGTKLVQALEKEALSKGAVTIYLGTDDEFDRTSLSNVDLYDNLYSEIENIKNLKMHPFEFYQKNGYKIVGVLPDVNGIGKPDIYMAKRIR